MNPRLYPLALGTFAVGTAMFVIAGLVAPVSQDLGVSEAAAGQLMTVFALAYAVLAPVLATLTARIPRKRLLLIATGVFTIGNALTALAPTFSIALTSRVVVAAGAALITPTAAAVASALVAPERRGRALAMVIGGVAVSTAIGTPLGVWLGDAQGWRSALWLVTGLGVLALAGLAVIPDTAPIQPSSLRERIAPLADRRVLAIFGTQGLLFAAFFAAYTYLDALMDQPLVPVLWAWGIGSIIGSQAGGRLTDALGPRRMVFSAITLGTVFVALIPVAGLSLPLALVWGLLWGSFSWLIAPSQQYRTVEAVPENVPAALGLLSSAQYVGIFAGGLAGGLTLGPYGPTGVIVLSVGLGVLALGFTAATYRRTTPEIASHAPGVTAPASGR